MMERYPDELWSSLGETLSYPIKTGAHSTRCKHGSETCDRCGTTDRRDVVHTTDGGRGSVSKLSKRPRV